MPDWSRRQALSTLTSGLAVVLSRPALLSLQEVARDVHDGYGDPKRALATLVLAEAQALAVPAATTFVEEQLREAGSG